MVGFRFYRRFKIFPGLRLNLSRSGLSTSIGGRGARFTLGRRGTRATRGQIILWRHISSSWLEIRDIGTNLTAPADFSSAWRSHARTRLNFRTWSGPSSRIAGT